MFQRALLNTYITTCFGLNPSHQDCCTYLLLHAHQDALTHNKKKSSTCWCRTFLAVSETRACGAVPDHRNGDVFCHIRHRSDVSDIEFRPRGDNDTLLAYALEVPEN
jgi:hypothetical protein